MARKAGNGPEDGDCRVAARTNGPGAGIGRPQGIYPNLRMSRQPIYELAAHRPKSVRVKFIGGSSVNLC